MRANDFVYHAQFGIGRVVSVATRFVTVDFNGTRKRFIVEESAKWLLPAVENQFIVVEGQLLEYIGEGTTVSIPRCVTKIGRRAFAENKAIVSVDFNSHVKVIDESAFEGCTKLTAVTGTNGLVNIGTRAFQDCRNLGVICLPDSLEVVEGAAFCGCKALKQVNIPPRIRKISFETFQGCNKLVNVTGMKGVKTIENDAFLGCSSLKIRFPEGLLRIERRAFVSCDATNVFEIPKSVTYIGKDAFLGSFSDPVISGERGSVAEEYARKQGFNFIAADNADIGDGQKILPKCENSQKQSQDKIPTTVLKSEPSIASHKATPQVSPAPSKKNKTSRILIPLVAVLVAFIGIAQYFDISNQGFINRISNEVQMAKNGEIQDDNGIYTGDLNKGVFDGLGTMHFADGRVYTGDWEKHLMHGTGNFQWTDGTAYAGQMSYGVIDGEGVVYYSNGSRYEGSFKNGLRFGTGTYYWANGDTFTGEWKEDFPHGIGTWERESTTTYIGIFDEGCFVDGEYTVAADNYIVTLSVTPNDEDRFDVAFVDGTVYSGTVGKAIVVDQIRYSSGDEYSGRVEDGLRNGQGTYTWATGESYQGIWKNDVMNGKGKFTFTNGDVLNGEFLDNKFIKGSAVTVQNKTTFQYTYESGKITNEITVTLADGTKYVGTYSKGKLTGTGKITYSDGDTYNGSIVNGKKSGQGKYVWDDNEWYEGSWVDDKMQGSGTYYFGSGSTKRLAGSFKANKPNGVCYYYTIEGTRYVTSWSNGSMTNIYKG